MLTAAAVRGAEPSRTARQREKQGKPPNHRQLLLPEMNTLLIVNSLSPHLLPLVATLQNAFRREKVEDVPSGIDNIFYSMFCLICL